jgi:alkylation response protein AidB-like acyl-CoA dehydrogenase
MTGTDVEAKSTACRGLLDAVRALAPRLQAASPRIEAERRLPDDLFRGLAAAGVFKAHLPPRLGGCGATLSDLAPVIEAIARADGSAGWLAYVGSEAVRQTLLLEPAAAEQITASPDLFIAGMFSPGSSRAVATDGGYRVTGRWHTCSGSLHSTWLIAGTTVYEADGQTPRLGPSGAPLRRLNFVPRSAVEVLDTWHVAGLKGTNSNDVQASDVFVPEAYGAYDVEPPDLGLHLMVPLGIARAAMDEFTRLATTRGPTKAHGTLYKELPAVQREVALVEASLRAARCYALASLAEVDARAAAGQPTTPTQRDDFFMAAHHAARTALEVVNALHRAAGTSGIFVSSRLLRCFLDVHVAVAHVSLQPINLEAAGRGLMQPGCADADA